MLTVSLELAALVRMGQRKVSSFLFLLLFVQHLLVILIILLLDKAEKADYETEAD
jgi:hypothetical protein